MLVSEYDIENDWTSIIPIVTALVDVIRQCEDGNKF
jgi:hypothetical protein